MAPTLHYFVPVLVDDVEGVAGERPDFLFHAEDGLVLGAVGGVYAQGWGEGCQLGAHFVCSAGVGGGVRRELMLELDGDRREVRRCFGVRLEVKMPHGLRGEYICQSITSSCLSAKSLSCSCAIACPSFYAAAIDPYVRERRLSLAEIAEKLGVRSSEPLVVPWAAVNRGLIAFGGWVR